MDQIQQTAGQCDVLTGLYTKREENRKPLLYRYQAERGRWYHLVEFPLEEPFRVDGTGGGCLLIRRSAIEAVRQANRGETFGMLPGYNTEDLCFSFRCYDLGIQTWCDPRIHCGHNYQSFAWPSEFVGELQAEARKEAVEDKRLFREVGKPIWLTDEAAAKLLGCEQGEVVRAANEGKVSARWNGFGAAKQLEGVEAETLLRWHKRGRS